MKKALTYLKEAVFATGTPILEESRDFDHFDNDMQSSHFNIIVQLDNGTPISIVMRFYFLGGVTCSEHHVTRVGGYCCLLRCVTHGWVGSEKIANLCVAELLYEPLRFFVFDVAVYFL